MSVAIKRAPIFRIFAQQSVIVLIICSVFWATGGEVSAFSSLAGGLIFIFPQLYFGYKSYQDQGARSALKIVQNFYKGESGKIILIAMGFAVVFSLIKPLDYFALFFTFISVLLVNALTPMLTGNRFTR